MTGGAGLAAACAAVAVMLFGGSGRGGAGRLSRVTIGGDARADLPGTVLDALRGASTRALAAVVATAVVVVILVAGPAAALLAAAGLCLVLRSRGLSRRRAVAEQERRNAVEVCTALAAELRAGRPPLAALEAAGDVAVGGCADALRQVVVTARLGGDVHRALAGLPDDAPSASVLRRLAACWQVSARTGGRLAAAVDRLADGLRAEQRQRRDVAAQLAGPRATARLLAVLPVAGIAMAAALGAAPGHVLLHTPIGIGCLFAGVVLDVAGVVWTNRLIAHALTPAP